MRGHEHDIGAVCHCAHLIGEPARYAGAQVGIGDAGMSCGGRVVSGVVGHADDRDRQPASCQHCRSAGVRGVLARSGHPDPGGRQVGDGVGEGERAEVERVIVGQSDAAESEVGQHGRGLRRGPEMKGLAGGRLAPAGDAAFKVDRRQVGRSDPVADLAAYEFAGPDRTISAPTPRPSIVSPASAIVIDIGTPATDVQFAAVQQGDACYRLQVMQLTTLSQRLLRCHPLHV